MDDLWFGVVALLGVVAAEVDRELQGVEGFRVISFLFLLEGVR